MNQLNIRSLSSSNVGDTNGLMAYSNGTNSDQLCRCWDSLLRQLVSFANKARHNGVVSLDADLQTIQDPFLKWALMLAVDGTEPAELRKIMRVSLDSIAENDDRLPSVFESAGGFSPTIGILGC